MFLTTLRISASNVHKMFLNIIVLGFAVVFSIRTNQRFNTEVAASLAGKKALI